MASHSVSGSMVPMSILTLSFTIRSVPLFGDFVEHQLEFSRLSTRVLPYPRHYSEAFAFSKFLCPLSHGRHLRLAFLVDSQPRGSLGLPCFD